jgi:hypothetical protein
MSKLQNNAQQGKENRGGKRDAQLFRVQCEVEYELRPKREGRLFFGWEFVKSILKT